MSECVHVSECVNVSVCVCVVKRGMARERLIGNWSWSSLTCTKLVITNGNRVRGIRRMSKSESATKALAAVSSLPVRT